MLKSGDISPQALVDFLQAIEIILSALGRLQTNGDELLKVESAQYYIALT